jgi:hypothetical protein
LVDHDRQTKRLYLLRQCVFETADSVLDLAFDLIGLAGSLQLAALARIIDFLIILRSPAGCGYLDLTYIDVRSTIGWRSRSTNQAAVPTSSVRL